jgi:hypothetical protein
VKLIMRVFDYQEKILICTPKILYGHRKIGLWPIMLPNCNYFVTKLL